tara:strand:+ start:2601 stop:3788 length:1188 start_codon:yes stop_codon:yes gene_type:complete
MEQEENTVSQEELIQAKPQDDGVIKVDLRQTNQEENVQSEEPEQSGMRVPDDEVQLPVDTPADNTISDNNASEEEPLQDDREPAEEVRVLEEVTEEEEVLEENIQEVVTETPVVEEKINLNLPENVEKLVEFMNETGGTLEDYVSLNKDVDSLDRDQLVKEYYKNTKPHLEDDEIDFLIEDAYSYDEDIDEERDIKRKKLLYKEEVQKAKQHLNGLKSKYYDEIKAGSKLTTDQKKAVDFFDRYNREEKESLKLAEKQSSVFKDKTARVFNEKFKGFEYSVGDKKYRFNVNDASKVKDQQSDLSNFTKKFLGEDNAIGDAKGYHKALFTAMNADAVANHFYQQGKSDAVKESSQRSKNIDMSPRGTHEQTNQTGGFKVRTISGDDSGKVRVKFKK